MDSRWILFSFLIGLFGSACSRSSQIAREYPAEVTRLAIEGGQGLPFFVGKDLRPEWKIGKGAEPRELQSFQMLDQLNQVIKSEELRGKVAVVSFFFTHCPGICPMTMKNLMQVQKQFLNDDRFVMISFSISPGIDSPARLKSYAKENHIEHRRWRLVTGDRDKIYRLARESFSADTFSPRENELKKVSKDDFLHSENVYLIDRDLKLRGVYSGRILASIEDLISNAQSLVQ